MRAWKGKERDRGERPETALGGLRRLELSDGREAWVVAEGCLLIPRYLSPAEQLRLSQSALAEYTRPPNPLSLSTHYILPDTPPYLFERYAAADPAPVYPRYDALDHEQRSQVDLALTLGGSRRTIDTLPGSVLGYEEIVQKNKGWKGMYRVGNWERRARRN
ncbi:hypothetical protein EHS25_008221 [Saitozyma podzolica]|uniref:Uncharacterized protein n=1 Tax=Saitozyma podzolica TaxID=1890683 RepID=A0A427YNW0_9TREE|nr:hypothetical protein EHS25_008221 [Saitozyma podzolica]